MEIYKVKIGFSPPIMSDISNLSENSSYNLRSDITVNRQNTRTRKLGFEIISTIGAIPGWLTNWIKICRELKNFKTKDKAQSPNGCPCAICKKLIKKFGYI